jgi:hypothetical protein
MKLQNLGFAVLGLALFQGVAAAEMISGTISGIDPQSKKMTLVRSDNQNPLTLSVKDQAQLLGLQPGSKVVVDAGRRFFGGWRVDSVTMASGTAAGNEADMNAGITPASPTGAANQGDYSSSNLAHSPVGAAHPEDANPTQRMNDNNPNPTADTTY